MFHKRFFSLGSLLLALGFFTACSTVPWHEHSKGEDQIKLEKSGAKPQTLDARRSSAEGIIRRTDWTVTKYASDEAVKAGTPYEVAHVPGNVMLNEGINEIWSLVSGGAGTAYNNANSRCGVGDSSTAESAAHTDLQASTNKLYVGQNATYPQIGSQQIVFKCDFASGQANFAWNEFTVDNGGSALKNLNRKVSAQGTKSSGQTWTLTLTITLS